MNYRQLLHKIRHLASEYLNGYSKHPADAPIIRLIDRHLGGWQENGEYRCTCGTIFGKNLNGESPFALVKEHIVDCEVVRLED